MAASATCCDYWTIITFGLKIYIKDGVHDRLFALNCDMVGHELFVNTSGPSLRAIPVTGKYKFWVTGRYKSPHRNELQKLNFSTIEFETFDDLGGEVKFHRGRTLLKFHLRPKER